MIVRISTAILCLLFFSCSESLVDPTNNAITEVNEDDCESYKIDSSLVLDNGFSQYLIAGAKEEEKFNISNSDIDLCKLNQGLGREYFPALYDPAYEPISEFLYSDDMMCIVTIDGSSKKVYPYSVLSQHETINETVNGEPVMIVYCELARLAAVYERTYCGKVLTFAPSGFTYFDDDYWDGVQGILMWDRESESLWWPLNDKCLSGALQGVDIEQASIQLWEYQSWGQVKKLYPDAVSLSHSQEIEIPDNLPTYSFEDFDCI